LDTQKKEKKETPTHGKSLTTPRAMLSKRTNVATELNTTNTVAFDETAQESELAIRAYTGFYT